MQPSLRTVFLFVVGVGAVIMLATMIGLGAGGENGPRMISDVGEAGIVTVAATVTLLVALALRGRDEHAVAWLLIGSGMATFAVGDGIWAFAEIVVRREFPHPGVPDAFYVAQYLLFCGALVRVAYLRGQRMEVTPVGWFAVASGIVLLGVLWFAVLDPYVVSDTQMSPATRALNIFYPIADILLLFVPAVFVVAAHVRGGPDGSMWAWILVAAGTLMLAASDSGFSYLVATRSYSAGAIVDYGWMTAHVLFAVGASLAYDAARPRALSVRLVEETGTG